MATDGPSWADQWGAGGIGAMEEDDNTNNTKKDSTNNKKAGGLTKAKAAAQKIKTGTSSGIKWIKNQCQKRSSSK